jgi:hypothetical protein
MGFGEEHELEIIDSNLKDGVNQEQDGMDAFKSNIPFSDKPQGLTPEQIEQWEHGWVEAAEQGDPDLNHI